MVLTGKQALDYSGGVSAEDNFGIGGYERVMGPNGQAQYRAPDLAGACEVLLAYYEHTYLAPGERFPRRAETSDPSDRDVSSSPHEAPGSDLKTVGEIFSEETNPGRKKPFDIRTVMRAVADADHEPLERWAGMREAEIAVTWDAHLGGWPVVAARHRVPPAVALRRDPGRRAGGSGPRARCSRSPPRRSRARSTPRPGGARWSCSPTWPASTARRSRCGGCSSSTAPRSGARSSTSTARSRSASSRASTAAPSSSSRARSTTTSRRSRSRARSRRCSAARPPRPSCSPATSTNRTRDDERIVGARRAAGDGRERRPPAAAGRARRAVDRGALGEARRGGGGVRRRPQRPARRRGRLGRPRDPRLRRCAPT